MRRILVVDDEPKILKLVRGVLEDAGYLAETCSSVAAAETLLSSEIFDAVVTDVRLPDGSGVDLLAHARRVLPGVQVVVITAYATVAEAVRAMKLGAFDYLQKPFEMETLRLLVERALAATALREEIQVLRQRDGRDPGGRQLVATSPAMRAVHELIHKVAATPSTVLIQGESGTGKELCAETIHRLSPLRERPLVRVNCLAIPAELMESELFGHVRGAFTGADQARKGWFEIASGSTLFLDEICGLPLALQGKLLRALEEQRITRVGSCRELPVDVRVLAASNVDLRGCVDQGTFREDLFYRLNVFPLVLPPLRERREDIPELARCLLQALAARLGRAPVAIAEDTVELLQGYDWPGNVRELRNILERAMVLAVGGPIGTAHIPEELLGPSATVAGLGPGQGFRELVEQHKAKLLVDALRRHGWVKKKAAEELGLTPRAFSHYVARYDLDRLMPP